ncbi:MAG: hypothetical protein MZW92_10230 [Comamonadaceae bacterium]|nr:hypothetical protein [Comamonadaceae bacterium]
MTLVSYARNLEVLYETPKDISVDFPVDRAEIRARFAGVLDRRPMVPSPKRCPRSSWRPTASRSPGRSRGRRRRGGRPRRRGGRLPGRAQGPVARHHPQDRRRRRGPRPRRRGRGPGRLPDR